MAVTRVSFRESFKKFNIPPANEFLLSLLSFTMNNMKIKKKEL